MKGEFAPLVVAVQKGFFRAEGLDVKVNPGSSATQALQSVAAGNDDLAYVPSVQLVQAVNNGMPVKAIATVVKVDSMGMVATSKFKLSSPKDLEGHSVEISAASTFSQIWPAFAARNKIDVGKVKVVRVAPSARFNLLLSGKVDILGDIFLTNEYPVLESKVTAPLNTLRVGDWGFKIIGYTLVASNKLIADHPDVIKRFNAAAMKAYRFTMEHPAEAAAIATKAYPQALQEKTTKGQLDQLAVFIKQGKPAALFVGSDEGWKATLDILKSTGAISEEKAPSAYYTNAFVPAGT
jgi:NitT/TauT family transport system substrate-binding protein